MEDHSIMPGVEIRDCGYKVGLNGVDNGAIRFSNVRIPRENLLDRFGSVAADGTYSRYGDDSFGIWNVVGDGQESTSINSIPAYMFHIILCAVTYQMKQNGLLQRLVNSQAEGWGLLTAQ